MKLIEPNFEIWTQEEGLKGIFKQIERAGRICYKSEDKITEDSAKAFVDKMIESSHTAMLEHGTVYLLVPPYKWESMFGNHVDDYRFNPFSTVSMDSSHNSCITTNLRVLYENEWLDDLGYICEPTKFHERRISLKFTTSIGITRELIRHRAFSFANESTRYCNYTKDKFGNELTFIKPSWFEDEKHKGDKYKMMLVTTALMQAEKHYMDLISGKILVTKQHISGSEVISSAEIEPMSPQQAREFLPLCTKSDIVMTGFWHDWRHFFDLRLLGTTGKPHPDMLLLTQKAKKVLQDNGLWTLIYPQDEKVSNN